MTNDFFKENKIDVLKWARYSPDLNIIENVFAELSNNVYIAGPIKNLNQLLNKIKEAVTSFNKNKNQYINNLYTSVPRKICDIIEIHGNLVK